MVIPGGMVYVGEELPAAKGNGRDPALIDPYLPVDLHDPDWSGTTVQGSPSYFRLSAAARGAYLLWLADGRSHPGVPISWVLLFLYGLERRYIVDAAEGWSALQDRPLIVREVHRLLGIYGGDTAFRACALHFLALIESTDATVDLTASAPPTVTGKAGVPGPLRLGLGEFAAAGKPVPVDWAWAWACCHPELELPAAAERCPGEFERLFRARFMARHGAGLRVQPASLTLSQVYQAVNPGIGQVQVFSGVPDVLELAAPTRDLGSLLADCNHALDAYCRYLGPTPDAHAKRVATGLLPSELADQLDPDLVRLTGWVAQQLTQRRQAVVDGRTLLSLWPVGDTGQLSSALSPAEAAVLEQLLGTQGVGIEADNRLGGPALGEGPVVLFLPSPPQSAAPTAAYERAALTMRLAVAIAFADGDTSAEQLSELRSYSKAVASLSRYECARLEAYLTWLLMARPGIGGLGERLVALDRAERESIGQFLLRVAASHGVVSLKGRQVLEEMFGLLRLDPPSIPGDIQGIAPATAPTDPAAPADEPVVVRPATESRAGLTIPPPREASPVPGTPPAGSAAVSKITGVTTLQLDTSAIAAKMAETAAVSALLGSIFDERDEDDHPVDAEIQFTDHPEADEGSLAAMDPPHTALLRALAEQESWARVDLEAACAGLELLPEGALDTLNEAALDLTGDPLAEGDDPVHIDLDVAREMLA